MLFSSIKSIGQSYGHSSGSSSAFFFEKTDSRSEYSAGILLKFKVFIFIALELSSLPEVSTASSKGELRV